MKALNIFQINLFHITKIAPSISHNLFTPKHENKFEYTIKRKTNKTILQKKRTQFNIDCHDPYLLNEIAHNNFPTLRSLPLFRKEIKKFALMFHDAEQYFSFFLF